MSLTYAQVQSLYHEIKPLITGSVCIGIKSVSPRSFVISLERDGTTRHLILSFQEGFLRFHFCGKSAAPIKNISFVDVLSENLVSRHITDCTLLNEDRILSLSFKGHKDFQLVAEFLPKRPNCYLLDGESNIISALNSVEAAMYSSPQKPEPRHINTTSGPSGILDSSKVILDSIAAEKHYTGLEADHLFVLQKKLAVQAMEKKLRKAEKRVEDRIRNLAACKGWQAVNHEGLLLQANLFRVKKGMKEVVVADWEQDGAERTIELNPLVIPKDIVATYFRRSKKLKAGQEHAERLLKKSEEELTSCFEQKRLLDEVGNEGSLAAYQKVYGASTQSVHPTVAHAKKEPPKPYHTFVSQSGIEIRVGKSAKDNDKLTFHCSKGLDWWMHARNYPGSHVVVHCQKGHELDEDTLYDAAELALRYSKAKNSGEGEVCLTQVKGLTRVKGTPGKVMLSKHKILRLVMDNKRWMRLKGCA
ncbi:MAG TPA: NFACT RNA binding domain-containing protein [Parachlamydiaceae bacterium]|nr:NFACT RNA binding domain-containing protein [Parachlamydiaceae bacterium]